MLDWDPNDPDAVKVHYDVSAWNLEQRAELSAALADDDIAHVWAGDELVVPEELEDRTDALFARLEDELGPFPIALAEDDPAVEYGLDEWPDDDRDTLTAALVESGDRPSLGGRDDLRRRRRPSPTVDELLDGIEAGTVVAGAAAAPPEDALPRLFAAADRLAKDADDRIGREDVARTGRRVRSRPSSVRTGQERMARRRRGVRSTRRGDRRRRAVPSDVIGAAQHLRSLVRPYV